MPLCFDFKVSRHNVKYKQLRDAVLSAQDRVYRAKAGYVRDRPVSAPESLLRQESGTVVLNIKLLH